MSEDVGGLDITFQNGHISGPLGRAPLVVSCGIGVDSVGLLAGLHLAGIRPDAILFAHVGSEHKRTYYYIPVLAGWLKKVGFPPLTIVHYTPSKFKNQPYCTLAGNCVSNHTLPSISFGRKGCSLKWKGAPLDKMVTTLFGDQPCYRAIGYDCSPRDNKRFAHAQRRAGERKGTKERPNDYFIYPLQTWGWTREWCEQAILDVGLPSPGKSSCTFCLSMKPKEVASLEPESLRLTVIIEASAAMNLRTVKGLWRKVAMTDFIRDQELLPAGEVDALWQKWSDPARPQTAGWVEEEIAKDTGGRRWDQFFNEVPVAALAAGQVLGSN